MVPRKVPPRLHRGFTKVPPRLHKSWAAKRFFGRFPHHFFNFKLVSQFLNSFLHFSPTAPALGYSAILKVLGQNYTFVFLGSLRQMAFASQKVLWFPEHFFALVSQSPAFFLANGCCFRKVLWRVPPTTVFFTFVPNGCCFIKVLGRVQSTVLHIYLPVSWGQSGMIW